jgi:hypothetical protein
LINILYFFHIFQSTSTVNGQQAEVAALTNIINLLKKLALQYPYNQAIQLSTQGLIQLSEARKLAIACKETVTCYRNYTFYTLVDSWSCYFSDFFLSLMLKNVTSNNALFFR